jgi:cytochrome P450
MATHVSLLDEVDALYACRQDVINDPYPIYARMRTEAPVLLHAGIAAVSRYDDAQEVLADIDAYSNQRTQGALVDQVARALPEDEQVMLRECVRFHDRWLVRLDPPDHTRIRGLAHRVFTPRRVATMREMVQETTDRLLDTAAEKREVDFIDEVAYRLPLIVVSSMLGVPPSDYDSIHSWSKSIATFIGNDFANAREMYTTLVEFRTYLKGMIAERRKAPHTDLLAALLTSDETGDRMSEEELEAMFILLLFAGHDTTTNLIGSGLYSLLTHPDQLARLQADPDLMPTAVEEFLRFEAPNQTIHRTSRRTTMLRGTEVPAGTSIKVMVGSANRDPNKFTDPETLDVGRKDVRHFAFGFGPHFCLGQSLARLEAPILIGTVVRRFPNLALSGQAQWKPNLMFRGLETLPVQLDT